MTNKQIYTEPNCSSKVKKLAHNFCLQTKGGTTTLKGSSMSPVLEEGWRIKVIPTEPREIKTGEIVVFSKNEGVLLTCHRVLGKFVKGGELFFLEKGDNNHYLPGIVSAEDVIGKVVEVRNEFSEVVSEQRWNKQGTLVAVYYSIVSFVYKTLLHFKRVLLGEERNNFTNSVCKLYWRGCFGLGRLTSKKE